MNYSPACSHSNYFRSKYSPQKLTIYSENLCSFLNVTDCFIPIQNHKKIKFLCTLILDLLADGKVANCELRVFIVLNWE